MTGFFPVIPDVTKKITLDEIINFFIWANDCEYSPSMDYIRAVLTLDKNIQDSKKRIKTELLPSVKRYFSDNDEIRKAFDSSSFLNAIIFFLFDEEFNNDEREILFEHIFNYKEKECKYNVCFITWESDINNFLTKFPLIYGKKIRQLSNINVLYGREDFETYYAKINKKENLNFRQPKNKFPIVAIWGYTTSKAEYISLKRFNYKKIYIFLEEIDSYILKKQRKDGWIINEKAFKMIRLRMLLMIYLPKIAQFFSKFNIFGFFSKKEK